MHLARMDVLFKKKHGIKGKQHGFKQCYKQ